MQLYYYLLMDNLILILQEDNSYFKKYLDSNKPNFIINTYGFGYCLDSTLLKNIAYEG